MRTISVNTFVSLDGVMQAPGGPEEDPTGGFELGGWTVNYWDNVMGEVMGEGMGKPFDLLLGRKTYEIFAAHWPHASEEEGAGPLNRATKYVLSNTLQSGSWDTTHIFRGDVVAQIKALKESDGPDLQVHGSSNMIQTLIKHNLVDSYGVWIFPVVLGKGKRLFGDGAVPAGLKLTRSVTSTTGVIMATYEPAGPIVPGSFALEQPTPAEVERRESLGA